MSIQGKARADIEVGGADKAAREFGKVGDAAKKSGADIDKAFAGIGKSVASFAASVVDAAVGFQGLDPKQMVASFFEYERQVTKTGIAVGQSVDQIRGKYELLARQNAVMPQQVDAFAKSLGRLTYDIKGAQDAFTAAHNAALAFGESDQEQIPYVVMLKNVMNVAGDTEKQFGKLIAQADKLNTTGGPRALRDLFLSIAPAIDQTITRLGDAREKTQALFGVVTAGMKIDQARRVGSGILGGLTSDPQGLKRTLGYDPFDREGHLRNPVTALQAEYKYVTSRWYSDEKRQLAAYESTYGMEAGRTLFYAMKEGRMRDVAGIAGLAPSGRATAAGQAYIGSRAGKADQKDLAYFLAGQNMVNPLADILTNINELVAKHPILAGFASQAIQSGLGKAAPLIGKALQKVAGSGIPAIATMAAVGAAGYEDIASQEKDYAAARAAAAKEKQEAAAFGLSPEEKRRQERITGAPMGTPSAEDIRVMQKLDAKALADELRNGSPIPMRLEGGPAQDAATDKDPSSRN